MQLTWLGPTHTRGDTAIFVEGENVLFTGDLAMKQLFPAFSSPYGDALVWLASLDRLDATRPKVVVGSHGGIGDASLISDYRNIFRMVQARVKELKAQGTSEADAEKMLTSELVAKYPNWGAPVRVAAAVKVFYKLP